MRHFLAKFIRRISGTAELQEQLHKMALQFNQLSDWMAVTSGAQIEMQQRLEVLKDSQNNILRVLLNVQSEVEKVRFDIESGMGALGRGQSDSTQILTHIVSNTEKMSESVSHLPAYESEVTSAFANIKAISEVLDKLEISLQSVQVLHERLNGLEHGQGDITQAALYIRSNVELSVAEIGRMSEQSVNMSEALSHMVSRVTPLESRFDGIGHASSDIFQVVSASNARLEQLSEILTQLVTRVEPLESRFDGIGHASSDIFRVASASNARLEQFNIEALDMLSDMTEFFLENAKVPAVDIRIEAERRVAFDSPDHLEPRGTINDNTRHPRFVRCCEKILPQISHLDLGCAGGGLVWDFSIRGHISVGIEGSDNNFKNKRAEWRVIPDRLFTADICYPYKIIKSDGSDLKFNLVTAWELFEHIPTGSVDGMIKNIVDNMTDDALLVCSIATFSDKDDVTGTEYHQTVKPRKWWLTRFKNAGLHEVQGLFEVRDFVRGSGNPRAVDWDVVRNPEMGFHLTLRRGSPRPTTEKV